ncbi:MAG: ferrous iron transport protein B [Deltaproteobacteria bacterium]|nr:ferrous iron transport protein B [Deltaproteobacteria bacterium]
MAARRSPDELVVALTGQPNCGKSTLFNAVAGFRVDTGNFAGTTVSYAETALRFEGRDIRLIDLPGIYSISSFDPAERVARDFLLSGEVDVVVNVVDASILSRSLELTLQLIEMKIPMVLCLNMMDEAQHKGVLIDLERLATLAGVPARSTVAVLGTGIDAVFAAATKMSRTAYQPRDPCYDRDVEDCIAGILARYPEALRQALPVPERFVTLRLLEMDQEFERRASQVDAEFVRSVQQDRRRLATLHGWPESGVLASHRHALVLDLYEQVATHHRGAIAGMREKIDRIITNPVGGLLTVVLSLLLTFSLAFFLGDLVAKLVDQPFAALRTAIQALPPSLAVALLSGLVEGVVAGAGIVLPYLVPLLLLLAVYEDAGLLPRIAFMVDGLLHRVGLHGKSVVPLSLGFGCNVPAIMATRNLENPRDRLITMLVIPFVTCSARSVVILALAGKYLGGMTAAALYLFGLGVAMAVSFAVSRSKQHKALGLIMEVPPLRRPYPTIVMKKVWLRLREFIVVAWPVILVSSVLLSAASYVGIDRPVNAALSPLTTTVLRLPEVTGIALFLGVFRKELALVMLATALGTTEFDLVLSQSQILVLVIFTMLYIPCIATLAALFKEGGLKTCFTSAALNFGVAVLLAGAVAQVARFFA